MKYNRILYICIFIASLVFVYYYGGTVPYVFFHIVILLPLISLTYTFLIFIIFRYELECSSEFAVKGESLKINVHMKNSSPLVYPNIGMTFYSSNAISQNNQTRRFSLDPFSERRVSYEAPCLYRGYCDVGINSVEFTDFLGIAKFKRKSNDRRVITVYPRVVYIKQMMDWNGLDAESLPASGRYTDNTVVFADVRKYQYGDQYKKIHWKLTAKTSEIQVKNFRWGTDSRMNLIMDLKKSGLAKEQNIAIEDKLIESAVAVIYYCLSRRIPIRFSYYRDRIQCVKAEDLAGFEELYKILSVLDFTDENMISEIIDKAHEGQPPEDTVIFTAEISNDLYRKLSEINFPGHSPFVVYVSSPEPAGEKNDEADTILSLMREAGMRTCVIQSGDEIGTVFDGYAV